VPENRGFRGITRKSLEKAKVERKELCKLFPERILQNTG
jgi:hypothetical protein